MMCRTEIHSVSPAQIVPCFPTSSLFRCHFNFRLAPGSEDNTAPLDVSDAQTLLCEDLPRAEISQADGECVMTFWIIVT